MHLKLYQYILGVFIVEVNIFHLNCLLNMYLKVTLIHKGFMVNDKLGLTY